MNPDGCRHSEAFEVWKVPESFYFCPKCGAIHSEKTQRFKKFYSFDIVGRSTATDILVSNTLSILEPKEKRMLVFSDNRQETAFQSGHLKDFQRRITFQHLMVQALKEAQTNGDPMIPGYLGRKLYLLMKKLNFTMPYIRR